MKKQLMLLILPLLIGGCSQQEESNQYQAINDQQTIMKEYYRQHTSNQSSLNLYEYSYSMNYDPTYDVFGALAPDPDNIGLYVEQKLQSNVEIYSGYFVNKNVGSTYIGNKQNVGSIDQDEYNESFWFRDFDEGEHDGELELIHRIDKKINDLDNYFYDEKTGTAVEADNVAHYFSNNINTDYRSYFIRLLEQPIPSTTNQVSAYKKSDTEIVETYKETEDLTPIENPIHPGEEHRMAVLKQTVGKTTFKLLDKIGWAGTEFEETITYSLVTDYELNLLETPRVVKSHETHISFTYASSMQPYSGDAFVFKDKDENIELYQPSLYEYNGIAHSKVNAEIHEVSTEYKKLHPEFSGYVYCLNSIEFEAGKLYSFATAEDVALEDPNYESIAYNELTSNAGGTIVSGEVEGHNLIKTIDVTSKYEFLILISSTGNKSLIAHTIK